MSRKNSPSRRGFSLIESILVVIVLAVTVPTAMQMLSEAAEARAHSADTARAVTLAAGVAEHLLADAHSDAPGLGFAALADPTAYLTTPGTGFYDRLAGLAAPYSALGLSYTVTIGDLADAQGTVTGDPGEDVFRRVTITVSFGDGDGNTLHMPLAIILAEVAS